LPYHGVLSLLDVFDPLRSHIMSFPVSFSIFFIFLLLVSSNLSAFLFLRIL
jgi:hypothetical protein